MRPSVLLKPLLLILDRLFFFFLVELFEFGNNLSDLSFSVSKSTLPDAVRTWHSWGRLLKKEN